MLAGALAMSAALGPVGASVVLAACGSFQARVDNAAAGSTITIPSGCTYREAVTIRKALTIKAYGVVVDGENSRQRGILVLADDVRIYGLTVTGVNGDSHGGAVHTSGADRFQFREGKVLRSATVCISLNGGSGHRIVNSTMKGCGKEGFFANAVSDTVFSGNSIKGNNPNFAWDPHVEAGAGKVMASRNVTFTRNGVHDNNGPGIWFDNDVRGAVVSYNRVSHNDQAGIFFEISNGAKIYGNQVWNNGFGHAAWGFGAGIQISSSDNAQVYDNVVAWNARGISVISQNRQYSPHNGNVSHDNVIVSASNSFVAGFYDDHGGTLFGSTNQNRGYGNRYWIGGANPSSDRFHWNGSRTSLTAYNATRGEEAGKTVSRTTRDLLLKDARVPLTP